jgi:enoyl-CoA hydratase/carnithine racemase
MTGAAADAGAPVLCVVADGVATVTLNRPDRMNAWTHAMEVAYFDLVDALDDDPDVRAVVLTGAGRGFCPGLDADDLAARTQGVAGQEGVDRPITYARVLRKPLIAAINGGCAGIGLIQVLVADLRFAAAGAKIATAFTRRGLVAEFGASWMLPRLVGAGNAMDLLLSGRAVTADEAHAMGLVNRVYPPDELVPAAQAYARDLAANCSPMAMQAVKAQVAADWTRDLEASQEEAARLVKEPARRPDFGEGVASFTEKRAPNFPPLPPRDRAERRAAGFI